MPAQADLRFAARILRRSPAFASTAVLTLALGIGANTAIFSVVNKVLLEPLPYPDPDRLVQLMSQSAVGNQPVVSIRKYIIWRDLKGVFQTIAAYDVGGPAVTLTGGDYPEAIRAGNVSADYFHLFGGRFEIGRAFSAQEDRPGGAHVAVISHRLWRARFHADPALVGRNISLETEPYKVIGVLADDFHMDPPADLWLPLQADPSSENHIGRVRVAARLAPGVTLQLAQRVMFLASARFRTAFPGTFRQVIGVVADVRDTGFNQVPMMYRPMAQLTDAMNARNNRLLPITWVIRTAAGSNPPTAAVQRELRELSGGRPLEPVRTMHEVVAASSARTGFYIMLLIPFAVIALLLAAVGLYGLIAYSVQQRTQEIGVRMALGAGPEDVRFMVMLQGMRLAFLGIVIGVPAALALTRVMVHLIFGVPTWDPVVLAAVTLLLSAVALFATCLPAIRATRIDPMDALRC